MSARCTDVSKATLEFSKALASRTPELRSEAGGVRQRAVSPASAKVAAVVTDCPEALKRQRAEAAAAKTVGAAAAAGTPEMLRVSRVPPSPGP